MSNAYVTENFFKSHHLIFSRVKSRIFALTWENYLISVWALNNRVGKSQLSNLHDATDPYKYRNNKQMMVVLSNPGSGLKLEK